MIEGGAENLVVGTVSEAGVTVPVISPNAA